jgi:uncharacterized membrane protein
MVHFFFILLAFGLAALAWLFFYKAKDNAWIIMLLVVNYGLLIDNKRLRKEIAKTSGK